MPAAIRRLIMTNHMFTTGFRRMFFLCEKGGKMDKINLRTTAFNDNDFEAEPFADAVISISQNCMPFEGFSITDVRLVNDDEDYPFGYAIVHAYYHEEEIYIDSMIPLHPDASELEAIASICLYMDREPLWKISVLQGPEAPDTYNIPYAVNPA